MRTKKTPLLKQGLFNFFLLVVLAFPLRAQNFHWESRIEPVLEKDYYRVLLPSEVMSRLRPDLGDIRIYDGEGKEVPYLVYKDTAYRGLDRFVTYEIVEKEYREGCCSHIVVKNTLGNEIDHIVIEVNNADAKRDMTLSGSYDGKSWFAVKDQYSAVTMDTYEKGSRKTTSFLKFNFPKTNYAYYKFDFDDWKWWWHDFKYPVFVVRAGYIEPTYVPEETEETSLPEISTTEDRQKKESVVRISFKEAQYVSHLQFIINKGDDPSPDYYRAASLYEIIRKDSLHTQERLLASTILSSLSGNEINLDHQRVKDLVLRVANHDDQPLHFTEAHAFEIKHYLVANLSPAGAYFLRYGWDTLKAPEYDLRYFKEKVPASPVVVKVSGQKDIFRPELAKTAEKGFFNNKAVVWIAIGLVGFMLVFMSKKMVDDMKR